MKIIYLHQYFNTPEMPGSTRSYEMAIRMIQAGHDVEIITSNRQKYFKQKTEIYEGIKVHWIPVPYNNHMNFRLRVYAFLKFSLLSTIKALQLKGDIIFATSTPLTIAIPGLIASKLKNRKLIFEVRDLWPDIPIAIGFLKNRLLIFLSKLLEKTTYKNSDLIVALSPGMKSGILEKGISQSKVIVIPNSCDNELFEKKANPSEKLKDFFSTNEKVLLYAGTIGKANGLSYLVKMASALQAIRSSVKILVIGEGAEKKELISLASEKDLLNKYIFFMNPVSKKEMVFAFQKASFCSSIFIDLKELRANSANKFFDALAASKPILINYGGWMKDLISDHGNGISAHGKDIDSVAFDLDSKINNDQWLHEAGQKSKKLSKTLFDRDMLAKNMIKKIEEVFYKT